MKQRSLVLCRVSCLILLLSLAASARDKTDRIILTNGDRLTGEIEGLENGILSVSLDYVDGTVLVEWSKVAHLESSQQFIVQTQEGATHSGALETTDQAQQPARIRIAETPKSTVVVDALQIVKIEVTSKRSWERLSGSTTFGINYSKANQATQYDFGTEADYVRERWALRGSFNSNLSSNEGAPTSARNQLNISGYRRMRRPNYFYEGIGGILQSSAQSISIQTTLGGGIGRFLKNTSRASISVIGGLAWQYTNYEQSTSDQGPQNATAALIVADLKFFRFKKTSFTINGTLLPVLSEPGRVRFNTNTSYFLKLFSNLSWNLSFYGNWDNRPPAGFSGSDYGSSSGLRWSFGNR